MAKLAVIFIMLVAPAASGQSVATVAGKVTDPDGRPLRDVVVSVQDLGISTATSAAGRYILHGVPIGQRVLQLRRLGFATRELTVEVTAGTPTTANAVLDPQPVELGAILVEGASRAPDRMLDAPAAVDVVQPATVAHLSITGQLPLALARVPGLDVVQSGVNDFNVNARGFMTSFNRKMLVLQDGRDLGTALVIRQTWGALSEPIEDLGRIEIIRGPGSALYGANAYTGVINITTPAARDVVGTKLTLGGGELGTARTDIRHAGMGLRDRLGYRVNFGYSRSNDWTSARTAKDRSDWREEYAPATSTPPTSPGAERVPLIGQTRDSLTGQALGTPDPLVRTYGSARFDYYATHSSMVTIDGGAAQEENPVFTSGNGRTQVPQLLRPWARLAWDAGGSGVSAWYTGLVLPDGQIRLSTGTRLENSERVLHLEARSSRTFGRNAGRLVVGASIQNNAVNSNGTVLVPAYDDRSDYYYGSFAQLEYPLGRVRLIGALRWDDSGLFTSQVSPKGAILYTPGKEHALRLSVNRAFLTPNLTGLFQASQTAVQNLTAVENTLRADPTLGPALAAVPNGELFTNSAAVPQWTFGNPHLLPQTMTSYEAGYKGQLGRRVFVTVDLYDAHIQNFTSGLHPAAKARLNPDYPPWMSPETVAGQYRSAVDSAVQSLLLGAGNASAADGLTRLGDGTTAIVYSSGNVGVVDEWGVEVGANLSLSKALSLSASYTWYNFAIRRNPLGDDLSANTPRHKGTVALSYTGRRGLDLGLETRVVAGYQWSSGIYEGYVPPCQTVNANAGYRINSRLRVYATGTNLLNQQRFQFYGGSVLGRRVLAGMTTNL